MKRLKGMLFGMAGILLLGTAGCNNGGASKTTADATVDIAADTATDTTADTTTDTTVISVGTAENASSSAENSEALPEEQLSTPEDYFKAYDNLFNSKEPNLTPTEGEFLAENEEGEIIQKSDGLFYGFEEDYFEGCSVWCAVSSCDESARASSFLLPQGDNTYEADHLNDGNRNTAWVEGAEGYGVGENFTITKKYEVIEDFADWDCIFFTNLCIVNGMAKNENAFNQNSRVKTFKMYFNDEYLGDIELLDTMKPQYVSLEGLHLSAKNGEESEFRFEIADVYLGDKYDDTVVTGVEIQFYTQNH